MTAVQDWAGILERTGRIRSASAFVVERPDRIDGDGLTIGVPLSLNTTTDLDAEFLRRTRDRLTDIQQSRIIPYAPGHRLETSELAYVRIDDVDGLQELIGLVRSGEMATFETDGNDRRRLLLYGVTLGRGRDSIVCMQKFTVRQTLKASKTLLIFDRNGVYNRIEDHGFSFDLDFDVFVGNEYVFATDISVLEQVMRYLDAVRAFASTHAQAITAQIAFANPDDFVRACETDLRFAKKAYEVVNRPTFTGVSTQALLGYARHHGVNLSLDQAGRIVFSNAIQERWVVLKLLDDDYLDSVLTAGRYEVNSKRSI